MADAGGGTTSNKTQIDYFTTVKLEANVTIEGNAGDTQKHLDFTSGELSGNINDAAVQKVIEEYECAAREWVESQKATSPGSAAILSYTVTGGITSYYYKSKDITTVVDNAILVGDIDDLDAAYLGNQGTLQVEKHQVYLIAVSATIKEDEVIELADVGKVWKELDATKPVPFTGEVNPSTCADKMALADESWNCVDGSAPIARSGGDGQYPLEGRQYSYGVTLTAKEGFVFSEKFADGSATFICDGTVYPSYAAQLSPDGKTLFVSGFLSAVTVGATAIPVEEASDNPAASTAKQASESAHSATSPDPQPVFETSPKPPSTGDDLPEMLPSILFIASAGIVLLAGSLLVLKRKSWKEHE